MEDIRFKYRGIPGIYSITNTVNNKLYIGSTINIANRWGEHNCSLRKGTHCNLYLQRSFNKYGEGNFKFNLLKITFDLYEAEKFFVDQMKPDYNLRKIDRHLHSEESKQKMRKPKSYVNQDAAKQSGMTRRKKVQYKSRLYTYEELAAQLNYSISYTKKLYYQNKL